MFRRSLFAAPSPAADDPRVGVGLGLAPQKGESNSSTSMQANRLLSAVPAEEFERIAPALETVTLTSRENLHDAAEARHIYFPEDAVISHLVIFEDGTTVETAMTGREGAVGLGAFLKHDAPTHWPRVTLPGSAVRMRAEHFRQEFSEGSAFCRLMLEHAGRHLAQVAQRAACINRHRIENRLATWLLMLDDRAGSRDLPLTQEFIAQRIGARRAGISEVFGTLQERRLIGHTRGAVRVLDRPGLEASACECYAVMHQNWAAAERA